jgi:hypothetical protein
MFNLPTELVTYIYTFDDTIFKNYEKCLKIIKNLPQIITVKTRKKYSIENIFGDFDDNLVIQHNDLFYYHFFLIKFDIREKYEVTKLYEYIRNIYNLDQRYYEWIFQILPSLEEKVLEKYK